MRDFSIGLKWPEKNWMPKTVFFIENGVYRLNKKKPGADFRFSGGAFIGTKKNWIGLKGNSGADSDGLDVDGLSWDGRTFITLSKQY